MLCSNSFKTIWLEPFCNTSEDETGTFCHFREFPANSCRLPWQVMFESFCPSIAWSSEVKLKSRSWKFSFPKRWMMQYGWKTYGFRCLKKFKCVKIQGNITPRPLSSPCLIKPVSPESELELNSSPNSTKWLTQMDEPSAWEYYSKYGPKRLQSQNGILIVCQPVIWVFPKIDRKSVV